MKVFKIDPKDKVAVALVDLAAGETYAVGADTVTAGEDIKTGHKIALEDIPAGEKIIKYGCSIGLAASDIKKGDWIHTHNVISQADELREFTYNFNEDEVVLPGTSDQTFRGYHRRSGETGTRNHIAVVSGVFCANPHIKAIAEAANRAFPKTEHFDGFMPLTHECGCGQEGEDLLTVKRMLAAVMQNPNFGGIIFVQVGCEITMLDTILPYGEKLDMDRIKVFTMQEEDDEFETGMQCAKELYEIVSQDRRTERPLTELHVGLQCGGSDGLSGLTANKLLGRLAERLTADGATVSMTEVTEMFGAEQILMDRAIDVETFEKTKHLMRLHRDYILKYGGTANGNPSFGNKAGGLTTIEDKSLGCVQKGGTCAIVDVLLFGDRAVKRGFHLVQGPGSDLVGGTSQMAAGANLEIFTTGRGTPVAFAIPTMKVATNNRVYAKKPSWIDFNAGQLLDGKDMEGLLDELTDLVLKAASGEYITSNERVGFYEIAFQRDGVIL